MDLDATASEARVLSVRAYPKGSVPPFNTIEEAQAATAPGPGYPPDAPEVDAAYVVVDAHLVYPPVADAAALTSAARSTIGCWVSPTCRIS